MKLIHLSDLHLGKRVNEFSMLEDQEYILTQIIKIADEEKPDGIMIAGDVYDKNIPSEEAISLWDNFLLRLVKRGIPVFAISGNHDSAVRFSSHAELIDAGGVHLSKAYDGEAKKYTLNDEYGSVNIYLLPFIKPAVVRALFPEEEIKDYTDAVKTAVAHMNINDTERNILIAHQFVTGALRCESEELSVGGLDNVNAEIFDVFDYVALGHIHGKQSVGRPEVRYCGTPLKYSFSEKEHKKSVTIVEMGQNGDVSIREVLLKPWHDLREIKGTYNELAAKTFYEGTATDDYIHAVLTDEDDVIDGLARLRTIYPNIMKLSYDNRRTRTTERVSEAVDVENKNPLELLGDFFKSQNGSEMSTEQAEYAGKIILKIWGD